MSARAKAALVGGALFLGLFVILNDAFGQTPPIQACGSQAVIAAELRKSYGELPAAIGFDGTNLLQLFLSDKGTWTLLRIPPSGPACIVSAGGSWEQNRIPGKDS